MFFRFSPRLFTQFTIVRNLPAIDLPNYNGKTSWRAFWDKYETVVHARKDIGDVCKLTYLLGCVKGEANKLISQLTLKADNYKVAIEILKNNFGDEESEIQTLVDQLVDLTAPSYNYDSLQTFRISLDCTIKALGELKEVDQADYVFSNLIIRKLPSKIRELLFNKTNKHHHSTKEILVMLQDVCKNLQRYGDTGSKHEAKSVKPKTKFNNFKGNYETKNTDIGNYTTVTDKPKPFTPKVKICVFCGENHASFKCSNYVSLSDRKDRINILNRCSRCTGVHHMKECKVKLNNCLICNREPHHSAFCTGSNQNDDKPQNTD